MKHAYLSLVLPVEEAPSSEDIIRIDNLLSQRTSAHELVIVTPFTRLGPPRYESDLRGPVSVVTTYSQCSLESATIAGIARTVGDFVLVWHGSHEEISGQTIDELLAPTDDGFELVEAICIDQSRSSQFLYWFVNFLRSQSEPVRRPTARVYSRRAAQMTLRSFAFEQQLDVIVAELPVQRSLKFTHSDVLSNVTFSERCGRALALLVKGSRLGSTLPILLAAISALFGVSVAIYAIAILILAGKTPEGWTTLMVVAGIGQSAILAMLGLTWMRLDSLIQGLSGPSDITADVSVSPPTQPK